VIDAPPIFFLVLGILLGVGGMTLIGQYVNWPR